MNELLTQEEFEVELTKLAAELPLLKTLIEKLPKGLAGLSPHLLDEVYGKLGVKPIPMYRRVAVFDPKRSYIFGKEVCPVCRRPERDATHGEPSGWDPRALNCENDWHDAKV